MEYGRARATENGSLGKLSRSGSLLPSCRCQEKACQRGFTATHRFAPGGQLRWVVLLHWGIPEQFTIAKHDMSDNGHGVSLLGELRKLIKIEHEKFNRKFM